MKDSFVYLWKNLTNGKLYVGYHKGDKNDGYICSSHNPKFWEDFHNSNMLWEREIIFEGTGNECLKEEQNILKTFDIQNEKYYNNARGAEIIWTQDLKERVSIIHKKRWENIDIEKEKIRRIKISKSKIGIPKSKTTRDKISKTLKGKSFTDKFGIERAKEIGLKISKKQKGKDIHTQSWKDEQSKKMIGNDFGKCQSKETRIIKRDRFTSESNPGKNKTIETKLKISNTKKGVQSKTKGIKRKIIICPYCGKEGGEGLMQRWHFNNCKHK